MQVESGMYVGQDIEAVIGGHQWEEVGGEREATGGRVQVGSGRPPVGGRGWGAGYRQVT